MKSGTARRVVLATLLTLAVVTPLAAQNPWIAEGGYYEQFDSPAGKFKTVTARWIWSDPAGGAGADLVAFFRCWRIGLAGGIGTNKFVHKWTLTGLDTDIKVTLPKWSAKLDAGFMDGQTRLINQAAQLAGDSAVLVEAKIVLKGTIGANEYVGCSMDISEHTGGFDGFSESR